MKPKKKTRMRTRKSVRKTGPFRLVVASVGLAALFSGAAAESTGREALGELIRQSDRPLAECLDEIECKWKELKEYFQEIESSSGRRHQLDETQISSALSKIDAIRTKLDSAKSTFDSQRASLSFDQIEDQRFAAQLLSCLDDNIRDAQMRINRLHEQFTGSGGRRVPHAARLVNLARAGESISHEAVENLVQKSKSPKRARKKAAKKKCAKKGGGRRAATGFETKRKFAKKKAKRKKAKAKRKRARKRRSEPSAKPEKNTYLALGTTGKNPDADGFVFEMLALELSGDVEAYADIGRFSEKKKVAAASGDGEQGCLEISTVDSAADQAFHSMCVRHNAARGGLEAYVLTPGGAGATTFLPGVEVAQLRMQIRSGIVTYDVRDADTLGAWTQVDQRAAPAEPLTISYGASLLGTGDEIGIDNLIVESLYDE